MARFLLAAPKNDTNPSEAVRLFFLEEENRQNLKVVCREVSKNCEMGPGCEEPQEFLRRSNCHSIEEYTQKSASGYKSMENSQK